MTQDEAAMLGEIEHKLPQPGELHAMTEENLKAAFAGESQAAEKYLVFAEKAAAEGLPNVANLFRAIEGLHERLMPLFKKNSA